ncbi:MAG TPA: Ivy family c-type lysozyme inhibitor [Albitalea sp.]|jgi:hypothetical protein|nr:Ivy family c-type lysozyme inhibitor [Albitalea sp.]
MRGIHPVVGARRVALAGVLACLVPACAQGKADAALSQRYGGVLALDCSQYMLPQLKHLGDSLVVQDAGKAVLTGRNVKAAPSHFGATPPPGFENAFTSEVAGAGTMVFVFYRNAQGLFATVEGSPKVMAVLPAVLRGQRVRHCDPNRNAVPGIAPPAQIGPPDLLKDARFREAYLGALGPLGRERWLARLDGPATPVKPVTVAGAQYQLVSVCKNHDCQDNNLVLLYAAPSKTVYGKLLQRGRPLLVGAPPPAVAAELERLWKAEWRSR